MTLNFRYKKNGFVSYLCHSMIEKEPTPYPERRENDIVLVCEPAVEYGKSIVYHGTTITNALKDYYEFTTNREKVDVLKWMVAQSDFAEMQRFSTVENKIYTLYANQYDEILKNGMIFNPTLKRPGQTGGDSYA